MNRFTISTIALSLGFALSGSVMAADTSKGTYQAGKDRIAAEYKAAKAGCDALSGNRNDICAAEAQGARDVALADLESSYKPTVKSRYNARIAKAEADYAVASERCDDVTGNAKDVCIKEAKAAQIAAKADAKSRSETSDANATAKEKSSDAREEAASDMRDADYEVAKEKCGAFAGSAKADCLDRAKAQFGKS